MWIHGRMVTKNYKTNTVWYFNEMLLYLENTRPIVQNADRQRVTYLTTTVITVQWTSVDNVAALGIPRTIFMV